MIAQQYLFVITKHKTSTPDGFSGAYEHTVYSAQDYNTGLLICEMDDEDLLKNFLTEMGWTFVQPGEFDE